MNNTKRQIYKLKKNDKHQQRKFMVQYLNKKFNNSFEHR